MYGRNAIDLTSKCWPRNGLGWYLCSLINAVFKGMAKSFPPRLWVAVSENVVKPTCFGESTSTAFNKLGISICQFNSLTVMNDKFYEKILLKLLTLLTHGWNSSSSS